MLEIYQPLIAKWLGRFGARPSDLNDLSQSVLIIVVRKLPGFEHGGRKGAFRAWIKAITRNCLLEFWRDKKIHPVATGKSSFQASLNQLADEASEISQMWNREYDEHVLASVLKQIQCEFKPQTWAAFQQVALGGKKAKEVADELGISINSVFIAKSRVMTRLRTVGKYMLD